MRKIKTQKKCNSRASNRLLYFLLPLLIIIVSVAFHSTLQFEFTGYDEHNQVVENPFIRSLSTDNLYRIFTNFSTRSYYPMRLLSSAVDYQLWGLNPGGHHLTNLILHILNVSILYLTLLRLIKLTDMEIIKQRSRHTALSVFFATSLFALHPVVAEPVSWIGAREELLMTLFAFLSFNSYLSLKEAINNGEKSRKYYILTTLFCLLSCLSNVTGIVIPILIAAFEFSFSAKHIKSLKDNSKRYLINTWSLWLIVIGAVVLKMKGSANYRDDQYYIDILELTLTDRILTIFTTFYFNMKTLIWPNRLSIMYPEIVSKSLFEATVLTGIGLTILLLFTTVRLRGHRLLIFGILFILIAMAPSSQIMAHHIFRADRFLYLPLAGISVVTAFLLIKLYKLRILLITVPPLMVITLAILSYHQSQQWRNSMALFSRAVELNPNHPSGHTNLGHSFQKEGNLDKAIEHYRRALEIRTGNSAALNNLGSALIEKGETEEAIVHLTNAIAINKDYANAYVNMGRAMFVLGRFDEAISYYTTSLTYKPFNSEAHNNLGAAWVEKGETNKALYHFMEAVKVDPKNSQAYNNLGNIYVEIGDYERALDYFNEALKHDADLPEARDNIEFVRKKMNGERGFQKVRNVRQGRNTEKAYMYNQLGVELAGEGKLSEALDIFNKLISLNPEFAEAYNNLGIVFLKQGDTESAIDHFTRAVRIKEDYADAHNNLGFALARQLKYEEAIEYYEKAVTINPKHNQARDNMKAALKELGREKGEGIEE